MPSCRSRCSSPGCAGRTSRSATGSSNAAYGETTRAAIHVVAGSLLVAVLLLKVVVVRWWKRMNRFLPHLGLSVFGLFVLTWVTSAGDYLFEPR